MSDHLRVRLEQVEFEVRGEGVRVAVVSLEHPRGGTVRGQAEGPDSLGGQLRSAAEATVRALERTVGGRVTFEVLGVKALHTFESILIVVSLSARSGEVAERLVGSCIVPEEHPRGAVLAALNATNRFLSRDLAREP